ncbi:MAG: hypothetical protein NC489_08315 [Ruminococcus flavefaciens]|nr:hypothetical protein [Ruminococcus flavefaciens]
MPKTNRSDTFYVKLPSDLATAAVPDAKMTISVSIVTPKGMEKAAQKTMVAVIDEASDVFKLKMKKAISKMDD